MYQNIEPYLEQVKGNTYCIVTGYSRLPIYMLDEKNCIMIDSGLPREWEGIEQCLDKEGLFVKAVIGSHYHPDHIGNHLRLRNKFGAKLYLSPFAANAKADPMNMLGSMAGIAVSNGEKMFRQYKDMPVLAALGIVDGENINIETIYTELRKQAQRGSATVTLPVVGAVTFGPADVDSMYRYIMS